MTTQRCINRAAYTAPAAVKTITIPDGSFSVAPIQGGTPVVQAAVQPGDEMFLQWSAGSDIVPSSLFTGWSDITPAGHPTSWGARLYHRIAQAGDAGRVITMEDTAHAAKVQIALTVLQAADTGSPVNAINEASETTSQTNHVGPTVVSTVTAPGKVMEFYFSQEGTAGASRAIDGAYTIINDGTNGSASNGQVASAAISNADVAAGTVPARTWTIDVASNKAYMLAVAVAPVSTTVTVFPQTDVTLPGGSSLVGGATGAAVLGDNDPNTYIDFGVSGVATHIIERFGSVANPLPGPLQSITWDEAMDGAVSVTVTPTLRNGTTPIATYAPHTFVAAGNFTWNIPGGDQTAQADLTNVQVDLAFTGS